MENQTIFGYDFEVLMNILEDKSVIHLIEKNVVYGYYRKEIERIMKE